MPVTLHLTFFSLVKLRNPLFKNHNTGTAEREIWLLGCLLGAQTALNVNAPCRLLKKGFGAKFNVDLSAS